MVLTAQTACTLGTVWHLPCPETRATGGLKLPPSGNPLMEEIHSIIQSTQVRPWVVESSRQDRKKLLWTKA